MEVIGAIDVRKLYSILVCVLLITTVFAGCIGEVQEGSYSEDVGAEDHDQGEEEVWACCKAMTASCIACSEGLTKQEWLDKTCGPGCTDAIYAGWDEETKKMKWDCIY